MRSALRRQLTYANVVSSICLFIVLGGGAYAAAKLPKNSVGSRQLASNAVTSSKVKNRSLLSTDFKVGQVPAGERGAVGPVGPAGPGGERGPTGPAGSDAQVQVAPACSAGTTLQSGFCFENAARAPADWNAAASTCAAAGRRLATPSELWAIAERPDVLMTAAELTTNIWRDDNGGTSTGRVATVFEFAPGGAQVGVRHQSALDDAAVPYRCVVNAGST
jgi:hypothetical protein